MSNVRRIGSSVGAAAYQPGVLPLSPGSVLVVYRALNGSMPRIMERVRSTDQPSLVAVPEAEAPATLVFVTTFAEAEELAGPAVEAAAADQLSWVAYPKAGMLGADLDRDSLAAFMTARGVRPVRQVALDDTWSALRFRPAT